MIKVVVGKTRREDVTKKVIAATFHPSRDEWYVVLNTDKNKWSLCTFTNGVCSKIEMFHNIHSAQTRLIEIWNYASSQEAKIGRMVMSGKLRPIDDLEGCTFEVYEALDAKLSEEGKDLVYVKLISPYANNEIVAETTCDLSELGKWLLDHGDY